MPKINVFIPRPPVLREKFEYIDPRTPDVTFTILLEAVDSAKVFQISERCAEVIKTYITGTADSPPADFPVLDGQPIILSEGLIYTSVTLEMMQVAQNPMDRYSVEEFITMSVTMPNTWQALIAFSTELNVKNKLEYKKKWTPATPTSPDSSLNP